ncbi:MAG: hypothetical protein RLZZ70_721 [Candidatus Parcubacteria bacterium]|jgi:hypothetical protein
MSIISEAYTTAGRKLGKFYLGLVATSIVAFIMVFVAWIANIAGAPGIALFIGAFATILILLGLYSPRFLLIFFLGGAAVAELTDEDISQGTIKGVKAVKDIFTTAGYWIMFATGFLGSWSFQDRPGAFWVIAFFSAFVMLSFAYHKESTGKWLHWIGVIYAIIVMLFMMGITLYEYQGKTTINGAAQNAANLTLAGNGASTAPASAPEKAEPWNNEPGHLDPITLLPGTTSIDVHNYSTHLQVCNNLRPAYVNREVQLPSGEWISSTEQKGRSVSAVRWVNTSNTESFVIHAWRQSASASC